MAHHAIDQALETVAATPSLSVVLYGIPGPDHSAWQGVRRAYPELAIEPQQGADLGQRMYAAAKAQLATHDAVILVGTDCPVSNWYRIPPWDLLNT